jgi:homoaconitase/3-isopropylmalate dehydratase large subunit
MVKIPKKKELLELQRKYRSDKRIAEVYGVKPHLVTYWRAKKRIGAYSFPKYSEEKIQEIWNRFGDDEKAGAELNITRAGFRQWRRKYNIDHRPAFLKLEQLELPLPDFGRRKISRKESIAQKILAKKSGLKRAEVGEIITVEPDLAISQSLTKDIIAYFAQLGAERIWNPLKIIIALDQLDTAREGNGSLSFKAIREFAKKHKTRNFYDVGQGICHQLMVENGHIIPGQLYLTNDHHAPAYGSLGALAMELTPEEIAVVWATGRIWLRVPETIKVTINGRLSRGVFARDIVLRIGQKLLPHVNYRVVELHGPVVNALSMSERMTLADSAADLGCKSAIAPVDDTVTRYLRKITKTKFAPVSPDPDACYANEIDFDIDYLTPQVGMPFDGANVLPIEEVAGRHINQIIIGCCANGRIDDFEIVARILRGRQVCRDTRVVVIPSSKKVLLEALDRGFIRSFLDSGCMIMNPGCDSCAQSHRWMLEAGEKALSTAAWNCPGQSSISDSEIYTVSPATAAASALEGVIADPRKYIK